MYSEFIGYNLGYGFPIVVLLAVAGALGRAIYKEAGYTWGAGLVSVISSWMAAAGDDFVFSTQDNAGTALSAAVVGSLASFAIVHMISDSIRDEIEKRSKLTAEVGFIWVSVGGALAPAIMTSFSIEEPSHYYSVTSLIVYTVLLGAIYFVLKSWAPAISTAVRKATNAEDPSERLLKIEDLWSRGLITDEERDAGRRRIVERL